MKGHGMTFSPEMVLAIRSGRKTQTRRLIDPQPYTVPYRDSFGNIEAAEFWRYGEEREDWPTAKDSPWQVGDRIWVKEAWRASDGCHCRETCHVPGNVYYEADAGGNDFFSLNEKRPSIHMPRWAARTWLEITYIRVQRIQEISEEDTKAEGIRKIADDDFVSTRHPIKGCYQRWPTAQVAFEKLWNSLYGPDAWIRNDWVWALTFRVLEEKERAA